MSHKPEPWLVLVARDVPGIQDSKGVPVCFNSVLTRDDAERIVACVNFCEGIDIEDLRAGLGRFVEAKLESKQLFITPKLAKVIKRLKKLD